MGYLESPDEPDTHCVCGNAIKMHQKEDWAKISKFLAGLNESYAILRRQIIMKKVLPSLVEVYNILDQDDSQHGFSTAIPPAAFIVSENVTSSMIESAIWYVQNGPNKGRPICSLCNCVGHIAERCYKMHGSLLVLFPNTTSFLVIKIRNLDLLQLKSLFLLCFLIRSR